MPLDRQARFIRDSLQVLLDTRYLNKALNRRTWLSHRQQIRSPTLLRSLARGLYGPEKEVVIPGKPPLYLVRLSLRETGSRDFSLFVFREPRGSKPGGRRIRCLVGHRFAAHIEQSFRWNLRQIFDLFGIDEDYSGFDGAAVHILEDLREKIAKYDFCLFDNRETTTPSKPNVYIEAGMAIALRRPFILTHYKREVWPSDFSNINYTSYSSYAELFQKLYARLPIFLSRHVRGSSNRTGGHR